MKNRPLVSIVLPVYNGELYLKQAVESCINQTYTNWNLIIVDDASTDSTPSIIMSFVEKDKRISSIRHDKNRRLPSALNSGFNKATGEYFTWMSDDNIYSSNALKEMVIFLEENKAIDVVYTNYTQIDAKGCVVQQVDVEVPEKIIYRNVVGACFLYKNTVHKSLNGYVEDVFLAEDYDFWLRAYQSFKFHRLQKNLYFYRVHNDSLSTKQKEKCFYVTKLAQKRTLSIEIDISPLLKERKLYIWGVGDLGRYIFSALNSYSIPIDGFIDNNSTKWGQFIDEKEILCPEDLRCSNEKKPYIIICSSCSEEIEFQLEEMGFAREVDFINNYLYIIDAYGKK